MSPVETFSGRPDADTRLPLCSTRSPRR
jgi:hypothetical protein